MNIASFYIFFHDPIWVVVLSTALFFPVRQLIWVLYVRKKQKSQKTVSDDEKKDLTNPQTVNMTKVNIAMYMTNLFNTFALTFIN